SRWRGRHRRKSRAARRERLLRLSPSKHADELDLEGHGTASEGMVEVEDESVGRDFANDAGKARPAVGRWKADHVADLVVGVGIAVLVEHGLPDALHQLRVAL